jgi:hypothetical protein
MGELVETGGTLLELVSARCLAVKEGIEMATFQGTFIYQSFCARSGTSEMPPQLAAPWAPRGELYVTTDAGSGQVKGTLTFAPGVELVVSGAVTPAVGPMPEGVELTGEGMKAIYNIRGFFIDGTSTAASGPVIVGTVVAVQNDLAKQPVGTSGPFVLFPTQG